MADLCYYLGATIINGYLGTVAQVINGAYATTQVVPQISTLIRPLSNPSESLEELQRTLKQFLAEIDYLDADHFLDSANKIKEQIKVLTQDSKETHFKNYSWINSWDAYLEPLTTLQRMIENRLLYPSSDLNVLKDSLQKAIPFIEAEIGYQTGFLKSTFEKIKTCFMKQFEADNSLSKEKQNHSPFMKLLHTIHLGKGNRLPKAWIDQKLTENLEEIERAYPQLEGIKIFIEELKNDVDYFDKIEMHLNTILYNYAQHLPKGEQKLFKEAVEEYLKKYSLFSSETVPLSVTLKAFELLCQMKHFHQMRSAFPKEQTLERIYKTILFLQTVQRNSDALEIKDFSLRMCQDLKVNLGSIEKFHWGALNAKEKHCIREMKQLIEERADFLDAREWQQVLGDLKKIFDEGSLLKEIGTLNDQDSPASKVEDLKTRLEIKNIEVQKASSKLKFEKNFAEIQKEARVLTHHLAMRSAFAFFSNRYHIESERSAALFQQILDEVEQCPYDGSLEQLENREKREAIFKKKINELIDKNCYFNFRILNWIVFKCVNHFISQFGESLVKHAQTSIGHFFKPSLKNRLTFMEGANRTILSLLAAESNWKKDPFSQDGMDTKDRKIFAILKKKDAEEELTTKVIDKALDDLIPMLLFKNSSSKGLLHTLSHFLIKKGVKFAVRPEQLLDNALETIRDNTYLEKNVFPSFDALLLEQIEAFEETLKNEDVMEETVTVPGTQEERIASELAGNLLTLLQQREKLSIGDLEPSLVEDRISALKSLTDGTLKTTLKQSILFANKQLMQDQVSQWTLDMLKGVNASFKQSQETSFSKDQEDLLKKFESEHHVHASQDLEERLELYEAALEKQHEQTQRKLYQGIDRMLKALAERSVKTAVAPFVKPSEETLSDYADFLSQQFDFQTPRVERSSSYVADMEDLSNQLCASSQRREALSLIVEKLRATQNKLLIQLGNQLTLLETIRTVDPSKINVDIKRLHQITSDLISPLEKIQECLMKNAYETLSEHLCELKKRAKAHREELSELHFVEENSENRSLFSKISNQVIDKGVPIAANQLANHVLMPLAKEGIAMVKSPSTFVAIIEQGLFQGYLKHQLV